VAIGAAWSDLLDNFASGAFLQVLRPINVGDDIEAGGVEGTVDEVGMFVTAITPPDNVRHYVGNSKIFSDNIKNFSANPYRRVELVAQLDNSADVPRAIDLLRKGLETVPNQVAGKPGDVEVLEFTERGPKLAVRPSTHTKSMCSVGLVSPCPRFPLPSNKELPPPTEDPARIQPPHAPSLAGMGLLLRAWVNSSLPP
jgi:small conductance mechanosensitive channel